jgi:hypothetical protein
MKMKTIIMVLLVLTLLAAPAAAIDRTGTAPVSSVNTITVSSVPTFTTTDLNTLTKEQLVSNLLGSGVTVTDIRVTGANVAAGTFSDSEAVTGISQGIILSTGDISSVAGPNKADDTTTINTESGNPDLDLLIPGYSTYDAVVLEIDFIPAGSQLEFNYVFGSEEYNEWVASSYNDVFGFFLNGANIALIPGTTTPVAINNVNNGANSAYFLDNDFGDLSPIPYNTELDGFTTIFKAVGIVNPGKTNTIKIAIADAGDSLLDSAVFIEAKSFSSADFFLTPETATNDVGETHVVTAELKEITQNGVSPIVEETVNFVVTSGPNSGTSGSAVTNSNGIATWSYSGSVAGTDTIKAFVGPEADPVLISNEVTKIWVGGQSDADIPEFPTIVLPMAAIIGLALVFQRRKEE